VTVDAGVLPPPQADIAIAQQAAPTTPMIRIDVTPSA
jgi:hypothetical protein